MTRSDATHAAWPVLPSPDAWQESYDTLHMWLQVVGKIRLSLAPWVNHSWGSTVRHAARVHDIADSLWKRNIRDHVRFH